jgi:hypothetical protein
MTSQNIFAVITVVGIAAILSAFIYIGRKLQVLDDLSRCIDKIKNNMGVISNYLTRNHMEFNPSELQSFSPFNLTDAGKRFIADIGFNNVFESNKSDFLSFISSENVKLKYDVESAAIKSIFAFYNKPYMEFLKVYFYNHPERSLENTAPTLGIYVRDKYLEAHPEITQ